MQKSYALFDFDGTLIKGDSIISFCFYAVRKRLCSPVHLLKAAALGALYALSMDKRPPIKQILPGIIAALISWMIVSIGFSFYVEDFAHYSLIYGTMGAMIVLLMWLYMTALVLILGAELNAALAEI